MGLINQDNRVKQDLTNVRTPDDVMRRLAKNVQITTDEVKGLTVEVKGKVDGKDIISTINQSAEAVTIDASKININGTLSANGNFQVDTSGDMACKNATLENATFKSASRATQAIVDDTGFNVYSDSYSTLSSRIDPRGISLSKRISSSPLVLRSYFYVANGGTEAAPYGELALQDSSGAEKIHMTGNDGHIDCVSLTQTSLEERKKNFEEFNGALELIKDIDIYKYNMKTDNDGDKKHIGFVIGDNYKYRQELTDIDNKGVDLYSFISVCCKAIQEQQAEIEELKKKVIK